MSGDGTMAEHKTAGELIEDKFPKFSQFLKETVKKDMSPEKINKLAEKSEAMIKSFEKR